MPSIRHRKASTSPSATCRWRSDARSPQRNPTSSRRSARFSGKRAKPRATRTGSGRAIWRRRRKCSRSSWSIRSKLRGIFLLASNGPEPLRYHDSVKTYDIALIGGGLIGGSIAFELARSGLKTVVLDRQEPGQEASWAAGGILSPAPENPSGIPAVPLARASLALYPEFVARIEAVSEIRVDFQPCGTLHALFSRDAARELSTLVALLHGLGLPAEPLRVEEARELEPALSNDVRAAALLPNEGTVDNRALTRAVLTAAQRAGAEVRAGAGVTSLLKEGSRCIGVLTGDGAIHASHVVLAAGSFSCQIGGAEGYAPVRPARGQMVAFRSPKVKIRRVLWSERIYLIPRPDGRIIAGSTVEYVGYQKGLTPAGLEEIFAAAREIAPELQDASIEEMWSGLRPDSPDHLPILGPTDSSGLLIATGHFRSGILLAPITAQLIREWILAGQASLDCTAFSPLRFAAARRSAKG